MSNSPKQKVSRKKFKRFNYKLCAIILILIGLYFFFYSPIESLLINSVFGIFFKIVKQSTFADIFWGLVFWSSLSYIVFRIIRQGRLIHWRADDFIFPLAILTFYLPHRLGILGQNWIYLSFKNVDWIYYADSVILLSIASLFRPGKKFKESNSNEKLLFEDNTYELFGDVFKREDYASRVAEMINNLAPKHSFAIAVTGSWGSGKSVFINIIRSKLDNSIPIKFNPWLSKASSSALEDFFTVIAEHVREYDGNLSNKFKDYANALLSVEEKFGVRVLSFLGLGKEAHNFESLEKKKGEIGRVLKEQHLKLVVLIDDLDRLTADEALTVLSLIRNSFDFPNVVFLVAFDHSYLLALLEDKKVPNPELFLEKIFQFDIDLPAFPASLLKIQMIEILCLQKTEEQQSHIRAAVDTIDHNLGLEVVIGNLRECIRFANSINHVFDKKYLQIDLVDFFLLELLKMKYKGIYQEVRNGLSLGKGPVYVASPKEQIMETNLVQFDTEAFKGIEEYKYKETALLILDQLFNRDRGSNPEKAINLLSNSIRYFSDQLFGAIDFAAFDVYKSAESFSPFKEFIRQALIQGKKAELLDTMARISRFNTTQAFFNFCKGIIFYCHSINDYAFQSVIFSLAAENEPEDGNVDEFYRAIYKILEPEEFPYLGEALFVGEILRGYDGGRHFLNNVLKKEEVRQLAKDILKKFIARTELRYDSRILIIHRQIADGINSGTNTVRIDQEANEIVRAYLLKFKKEYLTTNLIVPVSIGQFVLEPFTSEIFKWDDFEKLLYRVDETFETFQLKSFYEQYKRNDYKPVTFNFNLISINSDPTTYFDRSEEYPDIKNGFAVVRTQKINRSEPYDVLKDCHWLCHAPEVSIIEAEKGGTYWFQKRFDLQGLQQKIKSAKIYFMVDDHMRFIVNGQSVGGVYTWREEPLEINIIELLIPGLNQIQFAVTNKSDENIGVTNDPTQNPYDFVYSIKIELEDKNE